MNTSIGKRLSWRLRLAVAVSIGARAVGAVAAPDAALQKCAAIDASADRLACYDQLAGRVESKVVGRAAPSVAAASAAPAVSVAAPVAAAPAAPVAVAPAPPAAAAAQSFAPPAAPAPPPKEAFGLYRAEHPTAPVGAKSISAQIVALGTASNGRSTVTLSEGGVWQLDAFDPVLKNGASVTIERATLGSFLMTTPSGRTHRVIRLR